MVMKKAIYTVLLVSFALGTLVLGGCATTGRQPDSSGQQQQSQYIPPRPYTAA